MTGGYFHKVSKETSTIVWVNNPRGSEIKKALDAGALSCTTNPAYCAKVLQGESDYLNQVIDQVIAKEFDINTVAKCVYQIAAKRIVDDFLPLYSKTEGKHGFVTMQGDPRTDNDPDALVEEALYFRKLGPNVMAKIPTTKAGIQAMIRLIELDIPICATEIFTISQVFQICEQYRATSDLCKKYPPFYVTHITGIFDQLFTDTAKSEQIELSPNALNQAGCILARKQYRIMKERNYPGTFLGGGARNLSHFTEMVGGNLAVTLNWSDMQKLIDLDGEVISRINFESPQNINDELFEKLPNFRRAYEEDALSMDEFADFGPVVLFRTQFLNGYARLLDAIADRRLHHM